MATSTWETRELPLLEAIARDEEDGPTSVLSSEEVGARAGLTKAATGIGLRALFKSGHITGNDVSSHDGFGLLNIHLAERGRRAVGQWPSENAYDELIRLLDDRLARTEDEDERSRLRSLRDAAGDVGRGVLSAVIYDLGRRMAGMP